MNLRLLSAALSFGAVLTSNCTDPCGDVGDGVMINLDFTYCELAVQALDNRDSYPVPSTDNAIPHAAIGLSMRFESRDGLCWRHGLRNPLVSEAYACWPVPTYEVTSQDTIRAIRITTLRDYSADYTAGADATDLFKIRTLDGFVAVPAFVGRGIANDHFDQYDGSDDTNGQSIDVLTVAPAAKGSQQQFRVDATLSDGRVLTAVSPLISAL